MAMATPSADEISQAIVIWTGHKREQRPSRADDHVVTMLGIDAALDLLPIVHRLRAEFYESNAYNTVADLDAMGKAAATDFRRRHPELSEEAVDALAWCYTYD